MDSVVLILNNSSDVMMTLLIVKPAQIDRNRYGKIDLYIKRCLESKKSPQVMKFREKLPLLKIELVCHLLILNSYFFANQSLKRLDYTIK